MNKSIRPIIFLLMLSMLYNAKAVNTYTNSLINNDASVYTMENILNTSLKDVQEMTGQEFSIAEKVKFVAVKNLLKKNKFVQTLAADDDAMDQEGIIWLVVGILFGVLGLIAAYIITDDSNNRKMALYGCLISLLLYGGVGFLV